MAVHVRGELPGGGRWGARGTIRLTRVLSLLVDFPEWSPDLIHSLLNTVVRISSWHGNADWGQVSQEMKGVLQPDELEYLWNKLNTKLEPPTFQDVLVYIKRALKKTVHCEKCPEVDGLPKSFCSPKEFLKMEYTKKFPEERTSQKQSWRRKRKMTPTEKAPYYAAWIAEKANFELRWMNYLKHEDRDERSLVHFEEKKNNSENRVREREGERRQKRKERKNNNEN
ncbi:Protein of unknown function [Gryllus bimaculatus]|nr:Protein of unknown function [Gryllus bimaculatus]